MPITRTVVLERELQETDKVTPQGKLVVQLLGKGPMERSKLVAAVEKKLEGKTVQSAATIVAFQLTQLKKAGIVNVEKKEEKKQEKKKEAARKSKKVGESTSAAA